MKPRMKMHAAYCMRKHQCHCQRGFSLISLMVGSTICLLLAIATLQLFKSVTHITHDASKSAAADSALSSALLTSSFVVQSAGFGMVSPNPESDLVLLDQAQLSNQQLSGTPSTSAGNALLWHSSPAMDATVLTCEGIFIQTSDTEILRKGMYHLTMPARENCVDSLLGVRWNQVRPLALGVDFSITRKAAACSVFGQSRNPEQTADHVLITITARNSAGVQLSENYCLSNFSLDS